MGFPHIPGNEHGRRDHDGRNYAAPQAVKGHFLVERQNEGEEKCSQIKSQIGVMSQIHDLRCVKITYVCGKRFPGEKNVGKGRRTGYLCPL